MIVLYLMTCPSEIPTFSVHAICCTSICHPATSVVADIDDTEVIWIAFNSTQIKHWFYLKIEQNKNNINNYTYK